VTAAKPAFTIANWAAGAGDTTAGTIVAVVVATAKALAPPTMLGAAAFPQDYAAAMELAVQVRTATLSVVAARFMCHPHRLLFMCRRVAA
jgi:hypothetical protein